MQFEHFIITLFCFRGKEAFKHLHWPGLNFQASPLKPKYLEQRLKLFKMICLPGVLSQSNQNFGWIIIIDKDLDPVIKNELQNLIIKKQRAFLYEYKEGTFLGSTEWLTPYFTKSPDYVLTSNHDDDDILPRNFVDSLYTHIKGIEKEKRIPTIKLIGAKQILQWDLIHSKKSPFGWKSKWHRGDYPSSCGFSLLSKYPETSLSVLGLVHDRAEEYIDFATPPINKRVAFHRERLKKSLKNCNEREDAWTKEDLFYDISKLCGPVLMTNHSLNAQFARLYEKKADSKIVTGPESFPRFNINWALTTKNLNHFKRNIPILIIKTIRQRIEKIKRKFIRSVWRLFSS